MSRSSPAAAAALARRSRALHGAGYRVAVTDVDGAKAQAVAQALDGTVPRPSA
jgi:hypothetical protein